MSLLEDLKHGGITGVAERLSGFLFTTSRAVVASNEEAQEIKQSSEEDNALFELLVATTEKKFRWPAGDLRRKFVGYIKYLHEERLDPAIKAMHEKEARMFVKIGAKHPKTFIPDLEKYAVLALSFINHWANICKKDETKAQLAFHSLMSLTFEEIAASDTLIGADPASFLDSQKLIAHNVVETSRSEVNRLVTKTGRFIKGVRETAPSHSGSSSNAWSNNSGWR